MRVTAWIWVLIVWLFVSAVLCLFDRKMALAGIAELLTAAIVAGLAWTETHKRTKS